MAYNYDEESVNALMKWAENAQLPKEVMLSEAEHIFDTSMYVNAISAILSSIIRMHSITRLLTGYIG